MNEMISLENVTKTYKDKTVVDKLSLSVGKGEVFALLGANGAGKTTTIKMILGLAISRKIMEKHNGSLKYIRAEEMNCFCVRLNAQT